MWTDAFYVATLKRKSRLYSQDKQYLSQIQRARAQAVSDPGKLLACGGCCGMGESDEGALAWRAYEAGVLGMVVGMESGGVGSELQALTRRKDMVPQGAQLLPNVEA